MTNSAFLGTAAGNKTPFKIGLGIAAGAQKVVIALHVGTAAGNKVPWRSVSVGDVLADTTVPGTYVVTIPLGVTSILVRLYGKGGAGSAGVNAGLAFAPGAGGGAGGYVDKIIACTAGDTFSITIDGTSTRLSSAGLTANAGADASGGGGGAGGAASGGDHNTNGAAGSTTITDTGGKGADAFQEGFGYGGLGGAGGPLNSPGSAGGAGAGGGGGGTPSAPGTTAGGAAGAGRLRVAVQTVA